MVSHQSRKFRNAVLLSVVQEKLCCAFGDVQECIEFLAGGPVWTHQLPAWWKVHEVQLRATFPAIAAFDTSELEPETFKEWSRAHAEFLNAETEAWPLGGAPSSPFEHLPEGKPVIVVGISPERQVSKT